MARRSIVPVCLILVGLAGGSDVQGTLLVRRPRAVATPLSVRVPPINRVSCAPRWRDR